MINWSANQNRVFDFVTSGRGSAVVIAVAGSGKSTTIRHAARLVPSSTEVLMVAFNAAAAENLKGDLPDNVKARTFHSLGDYACRKYSKSSGHRESNPDQYKSATILDMLTVHADPAKVTRQRDRLAGEGAIWTWLLGRSPTRVDETFVRFGGKASCTLAGLGKQYLVGLPAGLPDTDATWQLLADRFDVAPESNDEGESPVKMEDVLRMGRCLFTASRILFKQFGWRDFDDMIYIPIALSLRLWGYKMIFVDEAQDTNPARRELLKACLYRGGRIVAVGDPHQAIYGFTGANSDALDLIKAQFDCIELPLTVSYRCPTKVVAAAREFVSHIEAAPDAPTGTVEHLDSIEGKDIRDGDAILSRKNAPLIAAAYSFLREGRRAQIMGRDMGASLIKFVDSLNAKSVPDLHRKLDKWLAAEIARAEAKGKPHLAEAAGDRAACVSSVLDAMPKGRGVDHVKEVFEKLFANGEGGVILSTCHKAKGMEWERVILIGREDMPSPFARQEWQHEQEINLLYVAYTRAKQDLVIVKNSAFKA